MSKIHKISVQRTFRIDAGHRILGHESKCKSIHGHSYSFEIYAEADELDMIGRVIDFGVLKEVIGQWIEDHWDHAMLLYAADPIAVNWGPGGPLEGQKCFILPSNPTAENLASFILQKSNELLHNTEIEITKVVCFETPNCSAVASL